MRLFGLSATLLATLCLSACNNAPQPGPGAHRGGRYLGIGTYPAGRMWSRMAAAGAAADGNAATIADDEQVIVVVDSDSGEVRQCGNLSGHCIGMNPWTGAPGRTQTAPIGLTEHAAEADAGGPSANIAEPVRPGRR